MPDYDERVLLRVLVTLVEKVKNNKKKKRQEIRYYMGSREKTDIDGEHWWLHGNSYYQIDSKVLHWARLDGADETLSRN